MQIEISKQQVSDRVREVIGEKLGISTELLEAGEYFSSDLGADSLDVYELIMELEKEFKIKIPDEVLEQLQTVGALQTYICNKTDRTNETILKIIHT